MHCFIIVVCNTCSLPASESMPAYPYINITFISRTQFQQCGIECEIELVHSVTSIMVLDTLMAVPYFKFVGFYYVSLRIFVILYKLVCSKTLTKLAFRRPNPAFKMKIKLRSESSVRLMLISNIGQVLYCGSK